MKVSVVSDEKFVQEMRQKIKDNGGYCPCALKKSPETRCMCRDFCDQIERGEPGKCHCGLYEVIPD